MNYWDYHDGHFIDPFATVSVTASLLYFLHSIIFPLFSVSFLIVKCFLRHLLHSPSFEWVLFLLRRYLVLLFHLYCFFFLFPSFLYLFSLVVILFVSYTQQFLDVHNQLLGPEKSLMLIRKMRWSEEMLIKSRPWKKGHNFEAHIFMSSLILLQIPDMPSVLGFYVLKHYVWF